MMKRASGSAFTRFLAVEEHSVISAMEAMAKSRYASTILAPQNQNRYPAHVFSSTYELETRTFHHKFILSLTSIGLKSDFLLTGESPKIRKQTKRGGKYVSYKGKKYP
jgi:hypothetical protein